MDEERAVPETSTSLAFWGIVVLFGVIGIVGIAVFRIASRPAPPPPEIAADPLLVRGREIYLERCVACHGLKGRGDGPLAKSLTPHPRNLVEEPWKYGEKPEEVLAVLANGVKDAQMPAWAGTYERPDLKAIAAYVYHVAGKPIPADLRRETGRLAVEPRQ